MSRTYLQVKSERLDMTSGGRRLLLVRGIQVHREEQLVQSHSDRAVREQEIEINAPDLGHRSQPLSEAGVCL